MATELIDTIVPQVPENWIIDKIKHQVKDKPYSIVDGPFGTQLHNDEYVDEGVPVVRIVNLNYNGQFDPEKLVFITEEKYQTLKRSSVEKGDLIIAKTGATIGKVGVFEGYDKGIIASSCLKISLNNNISSDFFKYYLISDYCQKQIILSSSGSTRDTINMEQISNLKIVLPQDIKLQQQIANYLDKKTAKIDATIAKNEELIQLLEEKRVALINQVVTKGLNPDVVMKDSGIEWIGEIPEHWEINRLSHYFKQLKNKNHSGNENNLLSLSYGKIIRKDIKSNEGLLPENFDTYNIVNKDDIVLRLTDLQNDKKSLRTGLVTEKGIITSAYITIRPINPINIRYIHYLLHSYDLIKVFYNMGAGVRQNLNYKELSYLQCLEPPYEEQEEIANYLDQELSKMDLLINKINEYTLLCEEYKASLIHHVVTGKIDVRGEEI